MMWSCVYLQCPFNIVITQRTIQGYTITAPPLDEILWLHVHMNSSTKRRATTYLQYHSQTQRAITEPENLLPILRRMITGPVKSGETKTCPHSILRTHHLLFPKKASNVVNWATGSHPSIGVTYY
jgi:hypothetical protein